MKFRDSRPRFIIMIVLVVLIFSAFIIGLLNLQIGQGAYYKELSEQRISTTENVTAARGNVVDRNGEILVTNRNGYNISISKALFQQGDQNGTILALTKLLDSYNTPHNDTLPLSLTEPFTFDKSTEDENKLIIRGTPVVVQLLLMYYVIFTFTSNGVLIASIAFGLNSGAYVSEIFRGGIMSIEKGQMEAGRSLGLNYLQTMWYIICPQVIKNVLPTLANEFIVLLKETSVAGYVAVKDLTFAGNRIRGVTFSPLMPLLAVAVVYLVLVMFFTKLVSILERRLRQSDIR